MSFSHLVKKLESAKVNEALIINEILKNTKQILNKEIKQKDIANNIHISHSTISRLLNRVGYASWNDFVSSCTIEEIFYTKSNDSLVDKMFVQATHLKQWMSKNEETTDQIIAKMKRSKIILFFGERMSGNIAQYTSFMMGYKDITTIHFFFEQQLMSYLGKNIMLCLLTTTARTNYNNLVNKAIEKGSDVTVIDVSQNEFEYNQPKVTHVKIPLISYVKEEDVSQYLKSNTLRNYLISLYEKL